MAMSSNKTTSWCSIIPEERLLNIAHDENATPELRNVARNTIKEGEALFAKSSQSSQVVGSINGREFPTSFNGKPPPTDGECESFIWTAHSTHELPGEFCLIPRDENPLPDMLDFELRKIYHFFYDVFGWKLFDNNGNQLHITLQYGDNCINAYWNGSQVVLGSGWNNFDTAHVVRFEFAYDVLAHELTHGLIAQTSGLDYRNEPGALNEHLADVFGVLYKQYSGSLDPEDHKSWMIGVDVFEGRLYESKTSVYPIRPAGGLNGYTPPFRIGVDDPSDGSRVDYDFLRSLADPERTYPKQCIRYPRHPKKWVVLPQDNGGVHHYSGIPNLAFHKAATKAGGQACWGVGQVWFRAMVDPRLRSDSTMPHFAALTIEWAQKEYPLFEVAILQGWEWVEVEPMLMVHGEGAQPSHQCLGPTPLCRRTSLPKGTPNIDPSRIPPKSAHGSFVFRGWEGDIGARKEVREEMD
ncbi:hypothetical protein BLS_006797 [Venturia inaequalis]|uniref:Neutral metalloproteinase n=1 Tax=Venturia inaequalis TaxID=5025 RepID=A0A8H3Z2D4_VENIN|nr:hypothetical protein BLS_006797 [Venturia inaequalis]KAE9977381.1 hypothetical protein EG327_007762 [Venturia inaequalis]KAE9983385.1 hypothetical protein EG328_010022 [Venturia inaequalis]